MSAEYKYTQVGYVTIIMILLFGAFTWFIFDAAIKSSESQSALMLKVIGLLVVGFFVFFYHPGSCRGTQLLVRFWGGQENNPPSGYSLR
jgi:hypothetical protein